MTKLRGLSPMRMLFDQQLKDIQALWRHDRNPERPYVRLRSGKISNAYFNGEKVCERPLLLRNIVHTLAGDLLHEHFVSPEDNRMPDRVVGPAMGAITLAHEFAAELELRHDDPVLRSFAEKSANGFEFRRSSPHFGERVLMIEDTITTGASVGAVRTAIEELTGKTVLPFLPCLCNRSGKPIIEGLKVISLIEGNFEEWDEGKNPFTPDGRELVAPIENVKDNWHLLMAV